MQLYIHEIVKEAEKKKTVDERKAYLRQFKDRKALRGLVEISYNKNIKILLPESDPPYKASELPEGMNFTRVDTEFRRFDIFLANGRYPNMNQTKRESIFIDILEALHPEEAKIFLKAFQHKFTIKGLRIEHINDIFNLKIPTPKSNMEEPVETEVTDKPEEVEKPKKTNTTRKRTRTRKKTTKKTEKTSETG